VRKRKRKKEDPFHDGLERKKEDPFHDDPAGPQQNSRPTAPPSWVNVLIV
jgi:hypothetical protein